MKKIHNFKITDKPKSWFIQRIGKKIKSKSIGAYNGEMEIKDKDHALYLCHVSQNMGYIFSDID